MHFKYSVLTASLAAALSLSGCGGGDSGGSSTPGGNTGVPPIKEPVVGGVVITTLDGYLKNALICSDLNNNGDCEANEVITDTKGNLVLTNDKGLLDIEVTKEMEDKFNQYPVVVKILEPFKNYAEFKVQPGIYTVDMDQPYQAMGKTVTFRAPAGSKIASPITDLVVAEINKGHKQAAAEANVLAMLDALKAEGSNAEIDLYADYIDAKASAVTEAEKELASKLHKTAQILTETQHQATADIELDDVTEQIVTEAVNAVNTATQEELDDPNYKPVVPVEKDDNDNIVVEKPVINHQAVVDAKVLDPFAAELATMYIKAGDNFTYSTTNTITGLFTDTDQPEAPQVSITQESYKFLEAKGIRAEIGANNSVIFTAIADPDNTKSKAQAGSYYLELAAEDKALKNGTLEVIGTVTTLVPFEVAVFDTVPFVDQDRLAQLQKDFDGLALQEGQDVGSVYLNIAELFTDEDGDTLTYTFTDGNTGLNYAVQYPEVSISGTPIVPGDFTVTITASDDDNNQANATIKLSIAEKPATNNPLSDILVGQNLYRFNAGWVNQGDGSDTAKPDCWAIRLTQDNKVFEAESVNGNCPTEDSIQTPNGSWELDGDDIKLTFDGESPMTLILGEDRSSDATMPRVHLNVVSPEATITKSATGTTLENESQNEPVTFYLGKQSADTYWQQPTAHVMVNGALIEADAASKSRAALQHEADSLDADLFLSTTCEKLGFEKDGGQDPMGNPSYRFGSNMTYQFHLLNDKFASGMYNLSSQDSQGVAFSADNGTACAIDFDYNGAATITPGESVVVLANPNEGSASEEFIINTYVDRNDTIEPLDSLYIDESGIYFTDIELGVGTVFRLYRDNDSQAIKEVEWRYSPAKGWSDPMPIASSFTAYQANGHQLFQGWAEDESYTIWTDNGSEMKYADAGIEVDQAPSCADATNDQNCIFTTPIYHFEKDAKAAIENALNTELNFVGTQWTNYYTENGKDIAEYVSYTTDGGVYGDTTYAWSDIPNDLPCLVEQGHSCTIAELNNTYNFCDTDMPTSWDTCPNEDKYYVTWQYSSNDGILHREKTSVAYGHTSSSRMVPIQ